jgi:5-oxoprolinase (ATP-hydrolysing)
MARALGFPQVSVSHEVSPLVKLVGRGDTTVVDAYLTPVLRRYVEQVAADLGVTAQSSPRLMFMMSSAASPPRISSRARTPSCPARPAAWSAPSRRPGMAGFSRVIGFDMGGTSTDVSHYDGEFERAFETEVAGVRMRAP